MKRCTALRTVTLVLSSLLAVTVHAQSAGSTPTAHVFGVSFECREAPDDRTADCASALLSHVRGRVAQAFVAQNGLEATSAELERLQAYNRAFERHDRRQRARKLAELDTRLAAGGLTPSEQERLEAFRAVLLRLARYEADVDAGIEPRVLADELTLRNWIETAKLNAALYAKYGGTIGVAAYGPYAHGAMRTLIAEHVARGDVRILDEVVATRFFAVLDAPPRLAHSGGEPDFTPFWERPIPPSYLPD